MTDYIDRQAAIDAICKAGCGSGYCGVSCDDVKAIEQLPSAEVEPVKHGRLVDADALKATFCAECNHTITCEDCDIDYHIGRLAPTIIEAEEGEGHEQN